MIEPDVNIVYDWVRDRMQHCTAMDVWFVVRRQVYVPVYTMSQHQVRLLVGSQLTNMDGSNHLPPRKQKS